MIASCHSIDSLSSQLTHGLPFYVGYFPGFKSITARPSAPVTMTITALEAIDFLERHYVVAHGNYFLH